MKKHLFLLFIAAAVAGCETTIYPELNTPEKILVVDAWIDQKMERQEIRITRSQPYFENSLPLKVPGAIVKVQDLDGGTVYDFVEGASSYYWEPGAVPFGVVSHTYRLTVTLNGETFEAYSRLGRVPSIDSIEFHYNPADVLVKQQHYTGEFIAIEPAGIGDTYWVKAWKNGVYLGKPGELNMAYDAGFTPGQSVDGQQFIIPIRKDFINPLDKDPANKNQFLPPYLPGDSLYVEIHSVDPAAYEFLWGVYYHITRPGGFAELFSTPLGNATTNLKSTTENSTTNIAGFFNVAAVSSKGQRLTQAIADEAKRNGK